LTVHGEAALRDARRLTFLMLSLLLVSVLAPGSVIAGDDLPPALRRLADRMRCRIPTERPPEGVA